MPYITGGAAAFTALAEVFSGNQVSKGVEKLSGIEGRRAERDAMSEIKGAQKDAIKSLEDKAMADRANEESRAMGAALRRRARAGQPGISQPLGASLAPQSGVKTLLGA